MAATTALSNYRDRSDTAFVSIFCNGHDEVKIMVLQGENKDGEYFVIQKDGSEMMTLSRDEIEKLVQEAGQLLEHSKNEATRIKLKNLL